LFNFGDVWRDNAGLAAIVPNSQQQTASEQNCSPAAQLMMTSSAMVLLKLDAGKSHGDDLESKIDPLLYISCEAKGH
jgi:hypothetical protein